MDLTRRTILKTQAAAAAAAAAGVSVPAEAQNVPTGEDLKLQWSKAPCRFCGTGCGVMVGVKDGRVVATHGDMQAEVNRGLNCVKGYFLSKIMYGNDRLTQPLMRVKNGQFAKDGELQPVSWDRAFDEMAAQWKRVLTVSLGYDPIWTGVYLTVLMEIAMITPPVGLNVFILERVSGVSAQTIFRGVWPFVAAALGLVLLLIWVPNLALWLPATMR
jgi:anaerobic selenocysteine-containing dehydrogenase